MLIEKYSENDIDDLYLYHFYNYLTYFRKDNINLYKTYKNK